MTKGNEIVLEWLNLAKENLLFAKAGLKEAFAPYQTIYFLCQASAEKFLKAYLISRGWELRKTHDLRQLVEFAKGYDADFDQLTGAAEILNDYITTGRYPADLTFEPITLGDAQEAVEAALEIERVVLAKGDTPSSPSRSKPS